MQHNPDSRPIRSLFRFAPVACAAALLALALSSSTAFAQSEDDQFLFTTSVPPNVLLILDNSGSMDNIVWHPAYDPAKSYDCNNYSNNSTYYYRGSTTITRCGRTRTIYHDPDSSSNGTRWTGHYLNWLFSSSNTYQAEIDKSSNGTRACPLAGSSTYSKYQRNRMSAAKQVVLDTLCRVNATKDVRFGLAIFRDASDPTGGFVTVKIDDASTAQEDALERAVLKATAETWTPLAETLFQTYTYFMSRNSADVPEGVTAGYKFPVYRYSTSTSGAGGAYLSTLSSVIPSPVDFACQKNFVILITDGEPTKDDFDASPSSTSYGFNDFEKIIGDYHADGETEVIGGSYEEALYLDDIAKFMHETDFRPDMPGDQLMDVYTIGFSTNGAANTLLKKTAENGNGLFFTSNNAEELTEAITKSITDIVEKSQSFTAATVPSTRTTAGGDFFTSFFLPSAKQAFWEGHLRAFDIDAVGDIFDKNGNCAFIDPDPGECNSGPFNPAAVPFWDAGQGIPASGSRNLYTSIPNGTKNKAVRFDQNLTPDHLGLSAFAAPPSSAPNPLYPGSGARNEEGLADEIVSFARGCEFATGVSGTNVDSDVPCTDRLWKLGDIFHSAPAVVTGPAGSIPELSYAQFRETYKLRNRVIYAGANDGFLHAFASGSYNTTTHRYSKGTGTELFGFMPWESRNTVRALPVDSPSKRHFYVDGPAQVADVWTYPAPSAAVKDPSEWRTILVGGLREGGRSYYSLDVTNPASGSFPGYLWEWPLESDPNDVNVKTSHLWYLGESWSKPIMTRVRVKIGTDDNNGVGFERWVAIVTGGFASTGNPNDHANYDPNRPEGRAIVMLDVKTGEPIAVKRYDASASDAQRDMHYAIPSTPAVFDLNGDGFADVVYVGDLGGQVFKWVIKPIGEDRVNDSSPAGDYSQPSWPLKKFFEAPVVTDSGKNYYKSMFFPPSATYVGKTLFLGIGTGERANIFFEGIAIADENNRFYVLTDPDPYEVNPTPFPTLLEPDLSDVSNNQTCSTVKPRGYYLKVADGEKFVTNSEIFAGIVFVGSFLPASGGDPCTSKGSGALYAFRVECGEAHFADPTGSGQRRVDIDEGLPTDPQISVGVNGRDNRIYIEKSGADLESIGAPDINLNNGALLYWREVR